MLSSADRKRFKCQAQTMEVSLRIGKKGLTPTVIEEIRNHLNQKNLLKVKLMLPKMMQESVCSQIINSVPCGLVNKVGSVLTLLKQ